MSNRIKTVPSLVFAMLLASVVSTAIPCVAAPRAADDCLSEPKHQTPRGGHWYYRFDHNRKCWYLGGEGQQISQTGSPRPLASSSPPLPWRQTEAAQTSLADAHAELQIATTPVTTFAEPPQWLGPAGILSPEKITEVVRDASPSETPPALSTRELESETRAIEGQTRTESRTEPLPEPKATEAEHVAELSGEETAVDPPRMGLALLLIGLGLSTIGGCLIFRLLLPGVAQNQKELGSLAAHRQSETVASAGCMVLAAAAPQDGPMATTVTEGEPRESRTSSATSMRWRKMLAIADARSTGAEFAMLATQRRLYS